MNKSANFIDNSDCPIKKTCGFYDKTEYDAAEVLFYATYCLNGGEGCGIKHHRDLTKKLKGGNKI